MKRLLIFSLVLFVTACGSPNPAGPTAPTLMPSTPTLVLAAPTRVPETAVPPTSTAVPSRPTPAPSTPTPTASPVPTVTLSPAARALLGVYDNKNTPGGPETLTLLDGGLFTQHVPQYKDITSGTWAISAGQIVFNRTHVTRLGQEAGPSDTPCLNSAGTYKWTFDGKALTFTVVNEPLCSPWQVDLTSGPWVKEP